MKIAMLILCHKAPEQIKMFIKAMKNSDITFFLHVDKKSKIDTRELEQENVIFISDQDRVDVQWAKISQVDAELALLIISGYVAGKIFPLKVQDIS